MLSAFVNSHLHTPEALLWTDIRHRWQKVHPFGFLYFTKAQCFVANKCKPLRLRMISYLSVWWLYDTEFYKFQLLKWLSKCVYKLCACTNAWKLFTYTQVYISSNLTDRSGSLLHYTKRKMIWTERRLCHIRTGLVSQGVVKEIVVSQTYPAIWIPFKLAKSVFFSQNLSKTPEQITYCLLFCIILQNLCVSQRNILFSR